MSVLNIDGVFDKVFFKKKLFSEHFCSKKLSYRIYNNAYVIPHPDHGFGGLADTHHNYIDDSAIHNIIQGIYYNFEENIEYINDTVVYFGVISKGWGHFLTDSLKRAWFFQNKEFLDHKTIIAISDDDDTPKGNYLRVFELLGIDVDKFFIVNKNTKFKSIIVPDSSFFCKIPSNKRFFTNEYVLSIRKIATNYKFNPKYLSYKKVYFSFSKYRRFKQCRKRAIGEKSIERKFKKAGYIVVRPERYSLDDQISMLQCADYFASTDGSCSHNSIFLKDYSNLIIIPRGPYTSEYQDALNYVNNLNINYIDSSLSIFTKRESPWGGPFYFYPSKFLCSFLGVKYNTFHFKNFKLYLNMGIDNNLCDKPFVNNVFLNDKIMSLLVEDKKCTIRYYRKAIISFLEHIFRKK